MGGTLVSMGFPAVDNVKSGKCKRSLHAGTKIYTSETNQGVRYLHGKEF